MAPSSDAEDRPAPDLVSDHEAAMREVRVTEAGPMPEKHVWTESDFREGELGDFHGDKAPYVGGRLRVARENYGHRLGIDTVEIPDLAPSDGFCYRATVSIDDQLVSTGTARSSKSDDATGKKAFLEPSLMELAETRAIARALRFGGFGVDGTGIEELQGRGGKPSPSSSSSTGGSNGSSDDAQEVSKLQKSRIKTLKKKLRAEDLDGEAHPALQKLNFPEHAEEAKRWIKELEALQEEVAADA